MSDKKSAGVFVCSNLDIIFNIHLEPSGACLPVMKPTWSDLINVGRTRNIHFASSLAYHLTSVLSRDVGLKFAGHSGDLPGFGRLIMVACNISDGTVPSNIA